MEQYIANIIEAGFANGLTKEQMLANPQAAAKSYMESQIALIDQIESNKDVIINEMIAAYNEKRQPKI
jgi:hypothetical protein